jgi:hypothetical protein
MLYKKKAVEFLLGNGTAILSTEFGNDWLKALLFYLLLYAKVCTRRESLPKEEAIREEKNGRKAEEYVRRRGKKLYNQMCR